LENNFRGFGTRGTNVAAGKAFRSGVCFPVIREMAKAPKHPRSDVP